MKYLLFFLTLISYANELVAQSSFSISTDKSVYSYNDPIIISITARNFGSAPDTLIFTTSCQAGYYIDTLNYMHHDSISITCEDAFTERIIPPNDSTNWGVSYWLYNFTGAMVGSGYHAVIGWVGHLPNGWMSDTLWIQVTAPTGVFSMAGAPNNYSLGNNYPNPFNPSTTIQFALRHSSHITMTIFNVLGEEIVTLVNEELPAGRHSIVWNTYSCPSGLYVSHLRAGSHIDSKKLLLQR